MAEIGKLEITVLDMPKIIKPLKKCWKGKDGKITQDEIARVENFAEELANEKITGKLSTIWLSGCCRIN